LGFDVQLQFSGLADLSAALLRRAPLRHRLAGTVASGERPHTEPDTEHPLALRRGAGQTIGADGGR
jgi:hypothetical protein